MAPELFCSGFSKSLELSVLTTVLIASCTWNFLTGIFGIQTFNGYFAFPLAQVYVDETCYNPSSAPHGNTHISCVELPNTVTHVSLHRVREHSEHMSLQETAHHHVDVAILHIVCAFPRMISYNMSISDIAWYQCAC